MEIVQEEQEISLENLLFQKDSINSQQFQIHIQPQMLTFFESNEKILQLLSLINMKSQQANVCLNYAIKVFKFLQKKISNDESVQILYITTSLSIFKKYISFQFLEKEEKIYNQISRCYKNISTDLLAKQILNSQGKEINLILYILQNKIPSQISDFLIEKLKEDFLIDFKKHQITGIKWTKLFNNVFSDSQIQEIIIPNCVKLIRKSEQNTIILNSILQQGNFDVSLNAELVLLEVLKDSYESEKQGKVCCKIAENILANISNLNILNNCIDGLKQTINSFNDDQQKYQLTLALQGAFKALKNQQQEQKISASIINFFLSGVVQIQSDDQFKEFDQMLQNSIDNLNQSFQLISLDIQLIHKLINGSNKYIQVFVCRLMTLIIKRFQYQPIMDEIITQIFQKIFLQSLKEPKKLVTNSLLYLSSLESITEFLTKNINNSITSEFQTQLPIIFQDSLYTNTLQFQQNGLTEELQMNLGCMIKIANLYPKEIQNNQKLLQILANNMIYSILRTNVTSNTFRQNQLIRTDILLQIIAEGVFNYVYFQDSKNIQPPTNFQKLKYLLSLLLKGLDNIEFSNIQNMDKVLFMFYNDQLITPQINKNFYLKIQNQKELILKQVQKSHLYSSHIIVSDLFLKSNDIIKQQGIIGFALALIDIGEFDLFKQYNQFLIKENYLKVSDLDQFINCQENNVQNFLQDEIKQKLILLQSQGYVTASEKEEESKANTKQVKSKSKSQKPTSNQIKKVPEKQEKIKMLDEDEMKEKLLNEHKQKMYEDYLSISQILLQFSRSRNPKSTQYFFEQFFNGYIDVVSQGNNFVQPFYKILLTIFENINQEYLKYKECISQFVISMIFKQSLNNKQQENFLQFQNYLLGLSQIDEFLVIFFHQLHSYIIKSQGLDIQLKKNAVEFYLKLDSKYNNLNTEIFDDFNKNINMISNFQSSQLLMERLLLLIPPKDISKLFSDILNNLKNSKKIVLTSLILQKDKLKYVPIFDDIIKMRILIMDEDEEIQKLSQETLQDFQYVISPELIQEFDVIRFTTQHSKENVDKFIKLAQGFILTQPEITNVIFQKVFEAASVLYQEGLSEEQLSFFPNFLLLNINHINVNLFQSIFHLLISKYCSPNQSHLMNQSLQSGIEIIKVHGQQFSTQLVEILEKYLKTGTGIKPENQYSSFVFLGVLSPFIQTSSVDGVAKKILNFFEKGPENIQKNLSKCLIDLMNFFEDPIQVIQNAMTQLQVASHIDDKRGQAYLIAGLTKGLGVDYINKLKLFDYICSRSEAKAEKSVKESILVLLEALLEIYQRLLEPYIDKVIQVVFIYIGDQLEDIRELSIRNIKILMRVLSGYGVKIILPYLLRGLNDNSSWRAKVNNIWALGNMAYCSPKQLSQCLPQIVPKLSHSLADTHPKIREAANESLTLIGSSIQNPEISQIVDILIQALSDPFEKNQLGLNVLLHTRFVHYIDAPALALVIPLIDYALKQKKDSNTKVDACQVVGSICTVIKDVNDILPYMNILVEGLRTSLGDPISDIRVFASKAIGKLAEKLGSQNLEKYLNFVYEILDSEKSTSIERQASSQTLAEILCSLGISFFQKNISSIFAKIKDNRNYIREGYLCVLVYVPSILQKNFEPFLKETIENTTEYVSDEDDRVKDVAVRVLKTLIQQFGNSNTDLLMTPINEGLFNSNWRKRNSAILLSGEMITVLKQFGQIDEDNTQDSKVQHYYNAFMGIYVLRFEELEQIKRTATEIWKQHISNTPRTLKKGLNILIENLQNVITREAHISQTAINCIKSFCQRYGETFFPAFLAYFSQNLEKLQEDSQKMRGIILIFYQYVKLLQNVFLVNFHVELVDMIKKNIYCHDPYLRTAVFLLFKILVDKLNEKNIHKEILFEIYENFKKMPETHSDYELHLRIFEQCLSLNSQRTSQYLVPLFFEKPIISQQLDIITDNAPAIAREVYSLFKNSSKNGMEILYDDMYSNIKDEQKRTSLQYTIEQLSINLSENDLKNFIWVTIQSINAFQLRLDQNNNELNLITSMAILNFFFYNSITRIEDYNNEIIQQMVPFLFYQDKKQIFDLSISILQSLYTLNNREVHFKVINITTLCLQNQIKKLTSNYIPGFNINDQGIKSFLEVATSSLVYNFQKQFELSLQLFDIIVQYTESDILQFFKMKLIGPLIRVANYRLDAEEKEKIMNTLNKIFFKKVDMKPFLPQLQSTYVKLIQENPRNFLYLKQICINMVNLIQINVKRDIVLNDVYQRFYQDQNNTIKEVFLYVLQHYTKFNMKSPIFAKALIERIFENCVQVEKIEQLNNNIIFSLSKIVGYTSPFVSAQKMEKYEKQFQQQIQMGAGTYFSFFRLSCLIQISAQCGVKNEKNLLQLVRNQIELWEKDQILFLFKQLKKLKLKDLNLMELRQHLNEKDQQDENLMNIIK